MKKQNNY